MLDNYGAELFDLVHACEAARYIEDAVLRRLVSSVELVGGDKWLLEPRSPIRQIY